MNEIERAIENFKDFLYADVGKGDLHIESIEIALAAIREKQERENGCGFCNSRLGIAAHHINEAGLQAGTRKSANFCPMCGRKVR